ncbi:hypothetical protein BH10ACI2_BH10ACI2_00700 [soil metagenome]
MKYLILTILVFIVAGNAPSQSKCFLNAGLKDEHRISYTVNGRDVKGELAVVREYDESKRETYPFTGTASTTGISVKFASSKIPDVFSKKGTRMAFTISTTGDVESLTLKLSTLINDRGWSNVYSAVYESCEPSYGTLAKTAKRVSFAKGARSATVPTTFTFQRERKAFLLGLAKGQRFSVTAIGCGISYFNPDKSPYDEGTAIDTWSSDALPQTGDYLFVISPAGEPRTCSVVFKTN